MFIRPKQKKCLALRGMRFRFTTKTYGPNVFESIIEHRFVDTKPATPATTLRLNDTFFVTILMDPYLNPNRSTMKRRAFFQKKTAGKPYTCRVKVAIRDSPWSASPSSCANLPSRFPVVLMNAGHGFWDTYNSSIYYIPCIPKADKRIWSLQNKNMVFL